MKLTNLIHSSMLLFVIDCPGILASATLVTPEDIKTGTVVEGVIKNSEAEKAEIKQGDVLLRWTRDEAKGEIETPFDMLEIEIEQSPRGAVKLEGFRGPEEKSWILKATRWGLDVRPNFSGHLLSVYEEGQTLAKAGRIPEAVKRWHDGAAEAREWHSSQSQLVSGWLFYRAAEQLADSKHWQESDADYRDAVQCIVGSSPRIVEQLLLRWGDRFYQRDDWDNAAKYYRQAIEQGRLSGIETLNIAQALNNLGSVSRSRDKLDDADQYYTQALKIRENLAPGSVAVAASLGNLGLVARRRGDLKAAAEYYNQMLKIAEPLAPESLYLAALLNNMGNLATDRGDLAKAEKYFNKALEIQGRLAPGSIDYSHIVNNLGNIAFVRGDLAGAEAYYRRALELREKIAPGGVDVANSLNNLGQVALARSNLDEAEKMYRQALSIKERLAPATAFLANTLYNLSVVAYRRHDLVTAREYQGRSLAIREKVAPEGLDVAGSMEMLARIAQDGGDLTGAEASWRRALAILESLAPGSDDHANTLFALASIMGRKQQRAAAIKLYQKAINALENQTARLGGGDDVRADFRSRHVSYYKDYIDLLLAENQPEPAFEVLERSRARTLLETLIAARIDIRKGVDPELLERERDLQSSLAARASRRIQILANKATAKEEIAKVDREINDLAVQYHEVKGRIRGSSPAYAALTRPQPLSAREIQQRLLDPDTLLLEYSLGEEHSYVFAVTRNSLRAYKLPKRAAIEETAKLAYKFFSTNKAASENERTQTSAALAQMLLGPVAKQLDKRRLLIVADGVLQYLPFGALPEPRAMASPGQDKNTAARNSPLLMASHEIINLPSASTLDVLRQQFGSRQPAPGVVAVIADPVFNSDDPRVKQALTQEGGETGRVSDARLPPGSSAELERSGMESGVLQFDRLFASRREAEAILAFAGQGEALKALDFDASLATATGDDIGRYRIVHFASHALLNSQHPELSGIVLSLVDQKGRPEDGFLRLQQIYNLKLEADLVVLSACQTALGKEINGEGLVGLTRGFMYAGSPRVVASLWNVPDKATAELMRLFYKGLLQDGERPAAALRAAQMAMARRKAWAAPYYWAGFTLQGEWR